jgi:small-conductance mechanosensitive channel
VAAAAGAPKVDGTSLLATTRQIAADQRLLTLLDERISARRDLAQTYEKWRGLLTSRAGRVLHDALQDVAIVLGIILALLFVDGWLERLLRRTRLDRRQLETLRSVLRVALQIVGIIVILLLLVGVPGQLGTMLGIAGAGLTVALKDFIVAFIGWLVLMGKNGIRLGDWVEINGVSGEVVELGMFHTVLLETGNWTEAGHPTGRRVTFTNSFAIQGHYFNFSTSGQWLWDELLVLVPYGRDPHVIADAIHNEVVQATAETARQAEQEWRRAVRTLHEAGFSAAPGIIVRPAVGGVEVAVRYVTRASERFALRTRLYQSAVHLLAATPAAVPA